MRKKKKHNILKNILKIIIFLIKTLYLLIKHIIKLSKLLNNKIRQKKINSKRSSINNKYDCFNEITKYSGDLADWENNIINSDSTIGIILGARGSGKSAFGIKLLENIFSKTKKKCYAIGFIREEMPLWIEVIEDIKQIKNNSFILIDEGGILFSARRAMSNINKLLSDLILISRHKNISIIFISQNSSNLDVNIIRQTDYLALKYSSLLQKDFERKKIKELYEEIAQEFNQYKDKPGITYIYSDKFKGFITNQLPSFWNNEISKSFS